MSESQSPQDVRAMCLDFACNLKKPMNADGNKDEYTGDEIIKIAEAFYNFVVNEGPNKPTLTMIKASNERNGK